jgi:hypothetical protein
MAPAGIGRRRPEVLEMRPLPGEVMVAQYGGPASQRLGDDLACHGIHRKRAQVLHEHQVRA